MPTQEPSRLGRLLAFGEVVRRGRSRFEKQSVFQTGFVTFES